ncbi:Nramp family divalent metal transporter [Streptomyces sp. NPDC001910]|uniref:Nramp family divalent metal transporter n=1 Tax=Streptomyces sp. NPDC001910 TaxID=3154403 RepID=UPI003320CB42
MPRLPTFRGRRRRTRARDRRRIRVRHRAGRRRLVRHRGGGTVPRFAGSESVLLATGLLGATLMPHVIYVHSSLTGTHAWSLRESEPNRGHQSLIKGMRRDVLVSLGLAGLANAAMLVSAARLFHPTGRSADTLTAAHSGMGSMLGPGAALAFAIALLASGFASSSVGTYAGQVIMSGFLNRSMPLALRRGIALAPPLVVLFAGVDPTTALVWSQVVLSFGIPFALVPLVVLTHDRTVMGPLAKTTLTTVVAAAIAALVSILNFYLIGQVLLA